MNYYLATKDSFIFSLLPKGECLVKITNSYSSRTLNFLDTNNYQNIIPKKSSETVSLKILEALKDLLKASKKSSFSVRGPVKKRSRFQIGDKILLAIPAKEGCSFKLLTINCS